MKPAGIIGAWITVATVIAVSLVFAQQTPTGSGHSVNSGTEVQSSAYDYLMSDDVQKRLRRAREADAKSPDSLRRYRVSQEFTLARQRQLELSRNWTNERMAEERYVLDRLVLEEAMWSEFLDAVRVSVLKTRNEPMIRKWDKFNKSINLLIISTSQSTYLYAKRNQADTDIQLSEFAYMKTLYPHVRARRESLVRAIMTDVYSIPLDSGHLKPWRMAPVADKQEP